jgi:SAM-dependent methyltransferase
VASPPPGLPVTGERTVPGVLEENYWFRRHERAYLVAEELSSGITVDMGSGEGYGAAMLAKKGFVVGMELFPDVAIHAAATYPEVRVVRGDACRLPFRRGSADTIVAMQVLEHLICADRFVAWARQILRPGGTLVLSTPNRETFSPDGKLSPFHVYEFSAEELEGLLRVHFEHVTVQGIRSGMFLRLADRLAGGSFQRRLMTTPWGTLSGRDRAVVRRVKASHFRMGRARGSLDLFAVAS